MTTAPVLSTVVAGGVSALNSDLSVILSALEVAVKQIPGDDPLWMLLFGAKSAAHRAALVQQEMLRYLRSQGAQPTASPLWRLIEDSRNV